MSIFSRNMIKYAFLCIIAFYTHMTITMTKGSSTDIVLKAPKINSLTMYYDNNEVDYSFSHLKDTIPSCSKRTDVISLLQDRFLLAQKESIEYEIMPIYNNKFFFVSAQGGIDIHFDPNKEKSLGQYLVSSFILNGKTYFVFDDGSIEDVKKKELSPFIKSYCEAIYEKFRDRKKLNNDLFNVLDIHDSLDSENHYVHSLYSFNNNLYYHLDSLLTEPIFVTALPSSLKLYQCKLLISDSRKCKYIFILNQLNNFFSMYGYVEAKKEFIAQRHIFDNKESFFKELFYEIYKKKYGLESCKNTFTKYATFTHQLLDIVYKEDENHFIVSLIEKTVINLTNEPNLNLKYIYSVLQYTLSKTNSSSPIIANYFLIKYINDQSSKDEPLYFSRKVFKDLFRDRFKKDKNENRESYEAKDYKLIPIDKNVNDPKTIGNIASSMRRDLEKNDYCKEQFLLTGSAENASNNQMVTLSPSTGQSQFKIHEIFAASVDQIFFNYMQKENYSKSKNKQPPTIKLESSSIKFLQRLMDRLQTIERRYADFQDEYSRLTKDIKENAQNINTEASNLRLYYEKNVDELKKINLEKLKKDISLIEKENKSLVETIAKSKEEYEKNITSIKETTKKDLADTVQEILSRELTEVKNKYSTEVITLEKNTSALTKELGEKITELKKELEQIKTNKTNDRYALYGAFATIAFLVCWNGYLSMAKKTAATL